MHCWERGRPVRTAPKAQGFLVRDHLFFALRLVRTRRPHSQRQTE